MAFTIIKAWGGAIVVGVILGLAMSYIFEKDNRRDDHDW